MRFRHSGYLGDIVYSLPAAIAIAKHRSVEKFDFALVINQPWVIHRLANHPSSDRMMKRGTAEFLKPLLEAQDYINRVDIVEHTDAPLPDDISLDEFKLIDLNLTAGHISLWHQFSYPVPMHVEHQWLNASPLANFHDFLAVGRSPRYQEKNVDYGILNKVERKVFLGTEEEFASFTKEFGIKNLTLQKISNALDVAQTIASAKAYIGNQSLNFAIAEGLKISRAVESFQQAPNVIPIGGDCIQYRNTANLEQFITERFDLLDGPIISLPAFEQSHPAEQKKRQNPIENDVVICVLSDSGDSFASTAASLVLDSGIDGAKIHNFPKNSSTVASLAKFLEKRSEKYALFIDTRISLASDTAVDRLIESLASADLVGVNGATQFIGFDWQNAAPPYVFGHRIKPSDSDKLSLELFGVGKDPLTPLMQVISPEISLWKTNVFLKIASHLSPFNDISADLLCLSHEAYLQGYRSAVRTDIAVAFPAKDWQPSQYVQAEIWGRYPGKMQNSPRRIWERTRFTCSSIDEARSIISELSGFTTPGRAVWDRSRRPEFTESDYNKWIHLTSLQEIDGEVLAERMVAWKEKPTFNIVIELQQGEDSLLADTIDSIAAQWYPNWHITIIADFESTSPELLDFPQISWVVSELAHFPSAINAAIDQLPGDWVVFLEAGGTLEPHGLAYFGDTINLSTKTKLIYCDEDRLSVSGNRTEPRFKPGFNLEMLRSTYYFGNSLLVKRAAMQSVGGIAFPGAVGLYDLSLKLSEQNDESIFVHQSDILIHTPAIGCRTINQELEEMAVTRHFERISQHALVEGGLVLGTQKITYQVHGAPLVSIVIPTKNQHGYLTHCIESLLNETGYPNFELIVVAHQTDDPDTLDYLQSLTSDPRLTNRFQLLSDNSPFNYAALCNLGAKTANGQHILFLDNDTEFIQKEWLSTLIGFAQQPNVAAVSPRLSKPDSNFAILNQGPRVLGLLPLARQFAPENSNIVEPGYFGNRQITQEVSALSGSCLLINAHQFWQHQGFNEQDTPIHEPVLELCLRLRASSLKLIWTPWADVVHHNRATRARFVSDETLSVEATQKAESEFIMQNHMRELASDPYYNRRLSLLHPFAIESHQVIDWDTRFSNRLRILGSPLSSGSGEYRVLSPFRALQKAGLAQTCVIHPVAHQVSRVLHPIELARAQPDSFLIQQAIDDTHIGQMKRYQKFNKNIFKAYAVDDILGNLPKKHYLYNYHIREGKSRLREALSLVDRLIVSTEPIADFCRDMISDIVVIPNRLESERWLSHTSLRRTCKKPRVGWAGAQQHLGDLELIKEVVEATHKEVDWIFMGMCPDFLKPYIHEEHKFVKFADYPAKLASLNLDLAIAPLEQLLFNEGKSNLRLLEYGIMGWPVVCSDSFPYRTNNAPVKRVQNITSDWLEAIRERIYDLDASAKEGDTLKQWVMQHYILENTLPEWLNALSPN